MVAILPLVKMRSLNAGVVIVITLIMGGELLYSPDVFVAKSVNPLNPGQFTRRVYRLPGPICDNVPVSVLVFLAA